MRLDFDAPIQKSPVRIRILNRHRQLYSAPLFKSARPSPSLNCPNYDRSLYPLDSLDDSGRLECRASRNLLYR
jgi:hypothetical protein